MPKATKTPQKKSSALFRVRRVVIKGCKPKPRSAKLSIRGKKYPNTIVFTTPDRDRVYEVKLPGEVFEGHLEPFSVFVWRGGIPPKLKLYRKVLPLQKLYVISALIGATCPEIHPMPDPPEIIVEA